MNTLPAEHRLRRNGRPEVPDFAETERLFRRYTKQDYVENQFSNLGFKFPKQSVNRERFSIATDVLFSEANEFEGWGVLSFRVQDLPKQFPPEEPRYDFFPKHSPTEENYSHSEVWCDTCIDPTGDYVTPSKNAKKLLRAFLSQRVVKEIEAQL